jgi:formate dehydrogenase subunit gamma
MWFVASIPQALLWIRAIATIVHALAALITIGAFIIHIYMGVAVVPGGVGAIVRGTVSEEWARHHHRLWSYRSPATHDARVDR